MARYSALVGYGTPSGYYRQVRMEVEADDIGMATKIAGDRVRRDGRRKADVRDVSVMLMDIEQ
jgi:hypothetical protein